MAQTPQQRRANAKFAKSEEKKMGRPESTVKKEKKAKAPISKGWVILLAFVVCGGLLFELLRLVPELLNIILNMVESLGFAGKK